MSDFLNLLDKSSIASLYSSRIGEEKLGDVLTFPSLDSFTGTYVILGVPEDIGPVANLGKPGAKHAWKAFLSAFLNIQNNAFIQPNKVLLLGEIMVDDLYPIHEDSLETVRKKVALLDDRVAYWVEKIKAKNKIPIVIGGGHNNAFPILKGCSLALKKPLQVINIDPHADVRAMEGRHSGNGFSYARKENYLEKYFVFGLHEGYNSKFILQQVDASFGYLSYDAMLQANTSLDYAMESVVSFFSNTSIGLEIDLDCLANSPASAYTPSGFSLEQLRKATYQIKKRYTLEYIHICEGAPTTPQEEVVIGKTISYLVQDLIK